MSAMKIGQTLNLLPALTTERTTKAIDAELKQTHDSFGETLSRAINEVNTLQQEAGRAVDQLAKGEQVDLHEVMIAAEKARTSFDLLMEIRNKALDAYRELMRTQV
jgi:flagellar hook-basal body complex protein FliE